MNWLAVAVPVAAGLVGVVAGAFLARRNEKKAQGERLLVEALNDAARAIAEVAGGGGKEAQNRYASAVSRIALHASPSVVSKFRDFQNDPTTATREGRKRLIEAVQEARRELGHGCASEEDLAVLLFGNTDPEGRFTARCRTLEPVHSRTPSVFELEDPSS